MTFTIDGIEWGTLIVKPTETPKVTSTVKPGLSQIGFFLYYNKKKHKLKRKCLQTLEKYSIVINAVT